MPGGSGEAKLIRHKRNISWYKQHSDFWNWYKYFTDTGNQKGVEELDRMYLAYLQNKNRAEGRRSYKMYLRHLGDIYKSCADSEDPNCVASYTSRPKPKVEPPKPAPVKACDPYRDPYCLLSLVYPKAPYTAPAPPPAPVKAPAPVRAPVVPVKVPGSGYYYYAPQYQPFLSAQQRAELLRICDAKDVECLQYHLRAAYGHSASAGPAPSYAHLGCDPKKDPNCMPQLVQKAPSGLYSQYPVCDPRYDPYCLLRPLVAQNIEAPPGDRPCNPLLDDNCNPLTATRLADLSRPAQDEDPKDEPAGARAAPCDPRYDPYCSYHSAAAMLRRPPAPAPPPPQDPPRHPRLGVRGKTKEGYDCYMLYDEECLPLRAADARVAPRPEEPYEPHLNTDGTRNGVIEPHPDCDPEYDPNCRLRRYEPQPDAAPAVAAEMPRATGERRDEPIRSEEPYHQGEPHHEEEAYPQAPGYDQQHYDQQHYEQQHYEQQTEEQQHYEPYQSGQEDPYASYGAQDQPAARLEDVLGRYGDQYPRYDDTQDHRAFAGDYRKK
ncbi:actinodin1 [Megalops cyprinoides]|uniref:actinodin1 n=1 Tax=Megalops cyprinoides TaxID=118141 RepID=UPI0018656141|nr:actinodin1 [Megalops cyprinoides]